MRLLAAALASLSLSAFATTPTTDFSDLWYASPAESESGWGVNMIQQNDIIFATLFVYAANGQPTWYVAPATQYLGVSQNGVVTFSGPLFATTGPWFGAPWNPALVGNRQVGTFTFAAGQISVGAISYTVDNVQVNKSIERQTWRAENLNGFYSGASIGTFSGCGGRDGPFESCVLLSIGHAGGGAITMREEGDGYVCDYTGAYSQRGRMGQITGTGTCSDNTTQTFTATEVIGGIQGVTMRFGSQLGGACSFTGRLGGIRRGP
jgi:hypothetical protein